MKIIEPSAELIDGINPAEILAKIERYGRVSHLSESKGKPEEFVRMLIRRGHESVLEHVSLTFHIVCDRAIMSELTRHRHASFTVESTRYVKYGELTFVGYGWEDDEWYDDYDDEDEDDFDPFDDDEPYYDEHDAFENYCRSAEGYYKGFLQAVPPEEARSVLPLCLKSELYMTANLREWRHILKLRTSKAAHPQMRFVVGQILNILRDKLPVIAEDIKEG